MRLVFALMLGVLLGCPAVVRADPFRYVDRFGTVHLVRWKPVKRATNAHGRAALAGARPASPAPAPARRDPAPAPARYDALVREAARVYELPRALIEAVITVESNYDPRAVSRKGAVGLMQLMADTAAEMGVTDRYDPRQNVLGGARYLRVLANRYSGDLVLTVAAYNAGPTAVTRYGGVPPFAETRRYVRRVLELYYRLARAYREDAGQAVAAVERP